MKKSIIAAGAASVALAAMPVVGVFAEDVTTQTDTLIITIDSVCSFGHTDAEANPAINVTGVAHANGSGEWGEDSSKSAGELGHPDTLAKTMSAGTTTDNLGKTTLGVYCNNPAGYTITASEASALTSGINSIAINPTFSGSASGWSYKVEAGSATTQRGTVKNGHTAWTADNNAASSPKANEVIAGDNGSQKTTENAGDFYTITYGVGVDNTQAAGTYTGHIVYTLGQPA